MSVRVAITSPIPSDPTEAFLASLPNEHDFLISDDSNGHLSFLTGRPNMRAFDYEAQKSEMGNLYERFEPFHKSAACRNFVHYLAYKENYDIIFSLDYDCVVPDRFVSRHIEALGQHTMPVRKSSTGWVNPLESDVWFSRGYPYSKRVPNMKIADENRDINVVLNMGLWKNVVDINGIDKVLISAPSSFNTSNIHTAVDGFTPLCGMNNAFVREIIPAYFFVPNFSVGSWTVSRHDDIWGGYVFQSIVRKRNEFITYGDPVVYHERESNQSRVLAYEHYMHILESYFYDIVDAAMENVTVSSYQTMFAHFSEEFSRELTMRKGKLPQHYATGFTTIADSFDLWVQLFRKLS